MKSAIVVIAAVFALAGCGSQPANEPAGSGVTFSQPPDQTDRSLTDQVFIDQMRENTSITGTDEEFLTLGAAVCQDFDNGATFEQVVAVLVNSGATNNDAGFTIGSSVAAFCDEHANQFMDNEEV